MFRVIVVDDERAAVDALARLLRLDGYDVVGFSSAAAGRESLESAAFDAVITDLEMPGVHGLDIVRTAHRMKHDAPVFVISAYADSAVAHRALAAGARRVFGKPLDYDVFAASLAEALGS
jgi:DNA-binding NtrC family response regulator